MNRKADLSYGFVILILLSASFGWLFPNRSLASIEKIGVDRTPIWLELKRGETTAFTVKVFSKGQGVIGADVADYIIDNEGHPEFVSSTSRRWSASKWLSFDHRLKQVKGREISTFSFLVRVPASSFPGTHNAAIFFCQKVRRSKGLRFAMRIGSRLLVRVPGKAMTKFDLKRAGVDVSDEGNVNVRATLSNSGDTHIKAAGFVHLRGPTTADGGLESVEPVILPGESRQFSHVFYRLKPGNYRASMTFLVEKKKIGREIDFSIVPKERLSQIGLILLLCAANTVSFFEVLAKKKRKGGDATRGNILLT